MKKILIIKLGYSETLDRILSLNASLGDVLRTTFVLHYFKNCDLSWLVDEKAVPLLKGNDYINRILVYNSSAIKKIKKEKFDIVVNFEKSPQVCMLSDAIEAEKHFGFRLNGSNSSKEGYLGGDKKLVEISQNPERKRNNIHCWQQILAESIDEKWQGEKYILGYKPKSHLCYDIGFNWTTSDKWSNKAWPKTYWQRLEKLINGRYAISWQQGMDELYDYIEWINSCRLIVTADTLGLHLALALKKRVVALFGPTSPFEIYFYSLGSFIVPESDYECIPCFEFNCNKKRQCMEYISPRKVKEKIDNEFKKIKTSR